jgi:XRE family transcriptional regulator, aerobic/anaerobic benzoate catabolism transcriptional regulator
MAGTPTSTPSRLERRDPSGSRSPLLRRLGQRIRTLRQARGLSRAGLASRAELSERFLNELEAGRGNISLERFERLARVFGMKAWQLLAECETVAPKHVALLGLRGAGKSTIGPAIASELGLPFVELDECVEREAGLSLREVFELQGEAAYRGLERDVLRRLVEEREPSVIATGGGIVMDPQAFAFLQSEALTVWLKARPEDHMSRVEAQGDLRPMHNRRNAMSELRALLTARAPLYAQADYVVDTSALGQTASVSTLASRLRDEGVGREG